MITKTDHDDKRDAVLVVAFGGPEKPEDIRPFLTRVTGGRVPAERLEVVARHYDIFGGKSPVNEITHNQAKSLETTLRDKGVPWPVYVGMRNWHPFLKDTAAKMKRDGIRRAIVVIMSVFQSRSSWDQYQTEIFEAFAQAETDLGIVYAKPVFDHPAFINTVSKNALQCLARISQNQRHKTCMLFVVHSLPLSDPGVALYVEQINRSVRLVCNATGHNNRQIAYQSRSGRPQDPWLEPDVNDVLKDMGAHGTKNVVVVPIGFVCDNVEVLYDLDTEARQTAKEAGITFCRAKTVGDDPDFIRGLADLVRNVGG